MTGAGAMPPGPARAALADYLSTLRRRSGSTWDRLARITKLSEVTLRRTARVTGQVRPEESVIAFVAGCGGSGVEQDRALDLWRAARVEERKVLLRLKAPPLDAVRTAGDLRDAAAAAYERDGASPWKEVRKRAGRRPDGTLILSERTIRAIIVPPGVDPSSIQARRRLPGDLAQFEAFLRGCRVSEKELTLWRRTWQQVTSPPAGDHTRVASALSREAADQRARASACKISPPYEKLLRQLSREQVDALLAAGTAHIVVETARRAGISVPVGTEDLAAVLRQASARSEDLAATLHKVLSGRT
ncbi:hypothetical protein [Streptomyces lavendulocolor]|uniref:hypothetical protein n=1 Tax=Streptomyces lavendulocolor TaxID=67316 RepID=UPI003C2E3F90